LRVVFVHLGHSNPRHLWLNLKRHREIFPDVPVSVVLSNSAHERRIPEGVDLLPYSRSNRTGLLLNGLAANAGFRGGFWLLTLERLIALENAHLTYEDESMLHVESDVLLMPNFPWMEIAQEKALMWGQISESEDIAAILYSPKPAATSALVELIFREATEDPETSDMRALHAIAARLSGNDFRYIPLGLDQSLINGGIFDVGSIGMWLSGMDERNSWGRRRFFYSLPHHLVRPEMYKYELEGDTLWVRSNTKNFKLFSLHVHSKDLKLFGASWRSRLEELVRRSNYQAPKSEFHLIGFLSNLKEILSDVLSENGLRALRKRLLG
jgi:hypothetical protein